MATDHDSALKGALYEMFHAIPGGAALTGATDGRPDKALAPHPGLSAHPGTFIGLPLVTKFPPPRWWIVFNWSSPNCQ